MKAVQLIDARRILAIMVAIASLVFVPRVVAAAPYLKPVVSGLASPLFVTHAGDGTGRLFIVEQGGAVRVLQPAAATPTLFLSLTSKVLFSGENGLLGLAFHPAYEINRRFFVSYTRAGDGATVIAEYRASSTNPNVADPAERVILVIPAAEGRHNGGMLAFGPDNLLYISVGDGGSPGDAANRAQNPDSLRGKVLRINIDTSAGVLYTSPSDNPFFGTTPGRDEIYALGFRNPWRFSFDRVTGTLILGDVGTSRREEVDIVTRGANYGWRVFEGTVCTGADPSLCTAPGFTPPIFEYEHTGGRCSITGGYIYRGSRGTVPAGTYIFGDFCSGEIFTLREGAFGVLLPATDLLITSFGEDEAGEVYVVGRGGTVHRIAESAGVPTGQVFECGIGFTGIAIGISAGGGVRQFESPLGAEHIRVGAVRSGYQVCYTIPGVGARTAFDFDGTGSGFGPPSRTQPNGPGTFPLEIARETADGRVRVTRRFTGNSFVGPGAGTNFDVDADGAACSTLTECGNCANRTIHVITRVDNLTADDLTSVTVVELVNLAIAGTAGTDRFARTVDSVVAFEGAGLGMLVQPLQIASRTAVVPAGTYAAPVICSATSVTTPTGPGDFEAVLAQPYGTLPAGTNTGNQIRLHYRRW